MTRAYTKLADYRPAGFTIADVVLQFDLDESRTRVAAALTIKGLQTGQLFLHGEDLTLEKISIDGRELEAQEYTLDDNGLTIGNVPEDFLLETAVVIDPAGNTRLEGLYSSSGHLMTQCEAEGFRRITYYPDRPDVLAPFEVSLRGCAQKYPTLLAGGNRIAAKQLPEGRHEAVFADPFPKPCYLFALAAGDFDSITDRFTTRENREVSLTIHTDKGNGARAEFAMQALKNAMRWDEQTYNFCYDLDDYHIVAVNDFNMGAMENKGLNIFNARLVLASPETATDRDYDLIDLVIAHEYFHNWTGNRITCRDWFQLSLKEGLTVFREQQYGEDAHGVLEKRIEDVGFLRSRQFPEDAGPTAHPVRPEQYIEINNFYTTTVYEKGAELIRMLYGLLGKECYYRGIEIYRQKHDGKAATCEDFLDAMRQAHGQDVSQFMRWYQTAGTPTITAKTDWQPNSNGSAGTMTLTLTQQIDPDVPRQNQADDMPPPPPLLLRLPLGFIDKQNGRALALQCADEDFTSDAVILRQKSQSFVFEDLPPTAVLSLNRGFAAPVALEGDFDWQTLARFDSDGFNRWDAKEQLLTNFLCAALTGTVTFDEAADEITAIFADNLTADTDPVMWALPEISVIAQKLDDFDPAGYYRIVAEWKQALAKHFQKQFTALYDRYYPQGGAPYPQGRESRRITHAALGFLAYNNPQMLIDHCRQARNMTERFTALAMMSMHPEIAAQAEQCREDFARDYCDDALVMNKWLALQGGRIDADNLGNVKNIIDRKTRFALTNPNNIYALLGSFVSAMTPAYHHEDGSGYRFFGEMIIELGALNPQVAARLLGMGLANAKQLPQARRERLTWMLQNILDQENLAPDIFEIADSHLRALAKL